MADDPVVGVLKSTPFDDQVKARAWDAFYAAKDVQSFKSNMDAIKELDPQTKNNLWSVWRQAALQQRGGAPASAQQPEAQVPAAAPTTAPASPATQSAPAGPPPMQKGDTGFFANLVRPAVGAGVQQIMGGVGGLTQMAGDFLGSERLSRVGERLGREGEKIQKDVMAPLAPVKSSDEVGVIEAASDPNWWVQSIGQGLGSLLGAVASGGVTKSVLQNLVAKGVIRGALGQAVARNSGAIASGGFEGLTQMGMTYQEALSKGASPEDAAKAAIMDGTVTGTLGAVGDQLGIFSPRPERFLRRAARSAAAEGVTEGLLQQPASNIIAQEFFDPGRSTFSGAPEAFVGGMGAGPVGAVFGQSVARQPDMVDFQQDIMRTLLSSDSTPEAKQDVRRRAEEFIAGAPEDDPNRKQIELTLRFVDDQTPKVTAPPPAPVAATGTSQKPPAGPPQRTAIQKPLGFPEENNFELFGERAPVAVVPTPKTQEPATRVVEPDVVGVAPPERVQPVAQPGAVTEIPIQREDTIFGTRQQPASPAEPRIADEVILGGPAPQASNPEVVTSQSKQLYEMSPEELKDLEIKEKNSERQVLVSLFGREGAAKYKELERRANSSTATTEQMNAAYEEMARMERETGKPREEIDRLIYGIGSEPMFDLDTIKDFRNALGSLDFSSPQDLGRSLSTAITDVGDKSDPSQMSNPSEQIAYAKLRYAFDRASEMGWNMEDVSKAAIQGAAGRFSDPADAEFMLKRFMKKREPQAQNTELIGGESIPAARKKIVPSQIDGGEGEAMSPAQRDIKFRYAFVEASDVRTSFDTGYRGQLQPRDTTRLGSRQRINSKKGGMRPQAMADAYMTTDGAPFIDQDGNAITRNHGTRALQEIYLESSPRAKQYRDWMIANAQRFGFDPQQVAAMKNPMLVRIVTNLSPEEQIAFAQESNMSTVAAMSAPEAAVELGKAMTGSVWESYKPEDEAGTPNIEFIRNLMSRITPEAQAVFQTAEGTLSTDGKRLLKEGIFAKAYQDKRAIERLTEDPDDNVRQITNGMMLAAPAMAMLTEDVANQDAYDFSIGEALGDAANILSNLRDRRMSVADWLKQPMMEVPEDVQTELKGIVQMLDRNKRSAVRISDILKEYARIARTLGTPRIQNMFGDPELPSKLEVLRDAEDAVSAARGGEQSGSKPPEAATPEGQPPVEGGAAPEGSGMAQGPAGGQTAAQPQGGQPGPSPGGEQADIEGASDKQESGDELKGPPIKKPNTNQLQISDLTQEERDVVLLIAGDKYDKEGLDQMLDESDWLTDFTYEQLRKAVLPAIEKGIIEETKSEGKSLYGLSSIGNEILASLRGKSFQRKPEPPAGDPNKGDTGLSAAEQEVWDILSSPKDDSSLPDYLGSSNQFTFDEMNAALYKLLQRGLVERSGETFRRKSADKKSFLGPPQPPSKNPRRRKAPPAAPPPPSTPGAKSKPPAKPPASREEANKSIGDKLKSKAEEARERMRRRAAGGQVNMGLDPEAIEDLAIIGADIIFRGAVSLKNFTAKMLKEFGDDIKPQIQEIYDRAVEIFEETQREFFGEEIDDAGGNEQEGQDGQDREGDSGESATDGEAAAGGTAPPEPREGGNSPDQPGADDRQEGAGVGQPDGDQRTATDDESAKRSGTVTPAKSRIVTVMADQVPKVDLDIVPAKYTNNPKGSMQEHQIVSTALAMKSMGNPKIGGFMLADGPGAGKTLTALAIADMAAQKGKKVLIVSKAEVFKFDAGKKKATDQPKGTYAKWAEIWDINLKRFLGQNDQLTPGEIKLATYNNFHEALSSVDKDTVVILDEAHALKNVSRDSARSVVGLKMMQKAGQVLYMSATPADRVEDIQYLASMGVFGSRDIPAVMKDLGLTQRTAKIKVFDEKLGQFVKNKDGSFKREPGYTYAAPAGQRTKVLESMLKAFQQAVGDGTMIKREIPLDNYDIDFQSVDLPHESRSLLQLVEDTYNQYGWSGGLKAQARDFAIRRVLEEMYVPLAVEYAVKEIEAGRKVILFTSRVNDSEIGPTVTIRDRMGNVIDKQRIVVRMSPGTIGLIRKGLSENGIYGDEVVELTSRAEDEDGNKMDAQEVMNAFNNGPAMVLIATVESGGTGLNLDDEVGNAPRTIINLTPPFGATDFIQMLGRIDRLATKSRAKAIVFFTDNRVSNWNVGILGGKLVTLGAVVRGVPAELMKSVPAAGTELIDIDSFDAGPDGDDNPSAKPESKRRAVRRNPLEWTEWTRFDKADPRSTDLEIFKWRRSLPAPMQYFERDPRTVGRFSDLQWHWDQAKMTDEGDWIRRSGVGDTKLKKVPEQIQKLAAQLPVEDIIDAVNTRDRVMVQFRADYGTMTIDFSYNQMNKKWEIMMLCDRSKMFPSPEPPPLRDTQARK